MAVRLNKMTGQYFAYTAVRTTVQLEAHVVEGRVHRLLICLFVTGYQPT